MFHGENITALQDLKERQRLREQMDMRLGRKDRSTGKQWKPWSKTGRSVKTGWCFHFCSTMSYFLILSSPMRMGRWFSIDQEKPPHWPLRWGWTSREMRTSWSESKSPDSDFSSMSLVNVWWRWVARWVTWWHAGWFQLISKPFPRFGMCILSLGSDVGYGWSQSLGCCGIPIPVTRGCQLRYFGWKRNPKGPRCCWCQSQSHWSYETPSSGKIWGKILELRSDQMLSYQFTKTSQPRQLG